MYHVKCDFSGCKAKAEVPTGEGTVPKGWVALYARQINFLASTFPTYLYCAKHGPIVTGKAAS
jgi:hypothetical protein